MLIVEVLYTRKHFATFERPNGVQFHKIGVGAKNGDGIVQVASLNFIMV